MGCFTRRYHREIVHGTASAADYGIFLDTEYCLPTSAMGIILHGIGLDLRQFLLFRCHGF